MHICPGLSRLSELLSVSELRTHHASCNRLNLVSWKLRQLVTRLMAYACLQLKKLPESMCGVSMTCCCYPPPFPMEVCSSLDISLLKTNEYCIAFCAVRLSANIPTCLSCNVFVWLLHPATCNLLPSAVDKTTELEQCVLFPACGSPRVPAAVAAFFPRHSQYHILWLLHHITVTSCDACSLYIPANPVGPCFSRFDTAFLHPNVQETNCMPHANLLKLILWIIIFLMGANVMEKLFLGQRTAPERCAHHDKSLRIPNGMLTAVNNLFLLFLFL